MSEVSPQETIAAGKTIGSNRIMSWRWWVALFFPDSPRLLERVCGESISMASRMLSRRFGPYSSLIRVDTEHPIVRGLLNRKLFLPTEASPFGPNDTCATTQRHFRRSVLTT